METTKVLVNDIYPIIKDKLDDGGEVVFTLTGNSMLPFMKDGKTTVTIKKVENKLKRGDIVFYRVNNQYILHRILRVKKNYVIICGDGLNRLEFVEEKNIFAVLVRFQNDSKVIDINNKWYRFKAKLWMLLRPIRKYLLHFYIKFSKKN